MGTIVVIAYNYTGSIPQWFVIITCSAILLQPIASYLLTMRRARLRVRRSSDETVIYTFTDDFLGISDSVGKIELLWGGINSVIKFDEAWVLGFPRGLDIIVPAGILGSDVKALIESKLQQAVANHKPIQTPPRSIDY